MTGRGDDDVVARRFELGNRRPVDLRIGDHRGQIVARIDLAVLGDAGEVGLEVLHDVADREQIEGALYVRIRRTEELLRELQHEWLVLGRHAQDLHHHAQRIPDRDVLDEVALPTEIRHPVDGLAREGVDGILHPRQALPREESRRQHPVLHVIRIVHLHQRTHEMPAACQALDGLGDHHRRERWPRIVDETSLVTLYLHHVRMTGDGVERFEAFRLQAPDRIVLAQPRQQVMDTGLVTPGDGVDKQIVEFRRSRRDVGHG